MMNETKHILGMWKWIIPLLMGSWVMGLFLFTFFQGDDFAILCWLRYDNPSPASWFTVWPMGLWRPFQLASLWVEVRLFGGNPEYYRILHGVVFLASIYLYQSIIVKTTNRLTAFIAALLFSATLSHWEALQWICASGELWMGFFFLLCLHSLLYYQESNKIYWRWLAIITHILALLCKESSVFLFPIFIIIWLTAQKSLRTLRCPIMLLGLSLPWFGALLFRIIIAWQGDAVEQGIFSIVGWHVAHNFGAYYLRMITHWWSQPPVWASMVCTVMVLITAGYLCYYKKWIALSALGWSILAILPYIGVNTPNVYPSRYTYLSGMGFYWLMALGIHRLIVITDFPRNAILITLCIALFLQSAGAFFLPEVHYWLRHDTLFEMRLNQLTKLHLPQTDTVWIDDIEVPPDYDKEEFFRTLYALAYSPPQKIWVGVLPMDSTAQIHLSIINNQIQFIARQIEQ